MSVDSKVEQMAEKKADTLEGRLVEQKAAVLADNLAARKVDSKVR